MTNFIIPGLDISVWQDDNSTPQMMDFAKAKQAGARFSYIKSSQGIFTDPDYHLNWDNATADSMPKGAYHYLDYYYSVIDQATYFANLLKPDPGQLPWVLDLEHSNPPLDIMSRALLFMNTVEDILGTRGVIYTSYGWWSSHGNKKELWRDYKLWFAFYSTNWDYAVDNFFPKLPWKPGDVIFWQHTSHGDGLKYGAESKNIDMNWYNGTEEQFLSMVGEGQDPPTNGGNMTVFDTYAKGISLNKNHTSIVQEELDDIDFVITDLLNNPMRDRQIQWAYNRSKAVVGFAQVDISAYGGVNMGSLPLGEADYTVKSLSKAILSGGSNRAIDAILLDATAFTFPDGTKLNGNWYKVLYEHIIDQIYKVYGISVYCYGRDLKKFTDNFEDTSSISTFWVNHGGASSVKLAFGTRRETLDLADFPLPGILYKPAYIYSPRIHFELISLTNFKFNGLGDANVPTWLWWGTKDNLYDELGFVERPVNDTPDDDPPTTDPPTTDPPTTDPPTTDPPVNQTESQKAFWRIWNVIYSIMKE